MIFDVVYLLIDLLSLTYDTLLLMTSLPSLIVNGGLALIAGAIITRIKPPKNGFEFAAPGKCIAHRGAALDAPENTLAAFKYCVDKGCKYIEFDIQLTKDGIPMVWHDVDIQGKIIANSTWEELKDLPVARGHPLEEKYLDTKPCTLKEALEFLNSKGVHSIIDMKVWNMSACTHVAKFFADNPTMYQTSIVSAFNPLAVYRIRKLDPKIFAGLAYNPRCFSTVYYSATDPMRYRYPNNIVKHLGARFLDRLHGSLWWTNILPLWVGCSVILIHKDITSPWAISKWQNRGYKVILWTVNQPAEKRMITKQFGVPYITDTLVGEDLTNGFVK